MRGWRVKIHAGDFVSLPSEKEFAHICPFKSSYFYCFSLVTPNSVFLCQQSSYSSTGVRVDAVGPRVQIGPYPAVFLWEAEALTLCRVIVGTTVTAFFAMETHGWCSALHGSDGQEALLYIGATVGCFDTRTCTHVTQWMWTGKRTGLYLSSHAIFI